MRVDQKLQTEKSIILNKKIKTQSFFNIKNQKKVPVIAYNKMIYSLITDQNGKFILYQELKEIITSLNKKSYHPIKDQNKELVY